MFKMFSTMTLLGLAGIASANAQSAQPIQAKVPFAFTVQSTTLPAGNYQLTYNNAHVLSIRGLDPDSRAAFATGIPATASPNAPARLVFDCYDKTCYLARVWQGGIGGGQGLEVPEPEPDRTLAFKTRVISMTIAAK